MPGLHNTPQKKDMFNRNLYTALNIPVAPVFGPEREAEAPTLVILRLSSAQILPRQLPFQQQALLQQPERLDSR